MSAVPALPPGVATIEDHRSRAREKLDAGSWSYLDGAAGDGLTAAANVRAWQQLPIWPRVLQPFDSLDTSVDLLGRRWPSPLLLAPLAHQRLLDADGELASAVAASAQGAGYVLSTLSNTSLEQVAQATRDDAGRGPLWFQLYLQPDRSVSLDLVRRAEASGYEALVLTVDAPVNGVRLRLPPGLVAVNLPGRDAPGELRSLAAMSPTWSDVEWLVGQTRLPVVLKGLLHPADAGRAIDSGVAAIVVSNHGGRTLDTVPATADALPHVVAAVQGRVPVLVDGGVRRGTDVLKALALGARAVLVGRPFAWGLASAGALGVAHCIRLLRDELEAAMALAGVARLDGELQGLLSPG